MIKNLSDKEKEELYQNMVDKPYRKSKHLYFRTIELFPTCIIKYFKQVAVDILGQEDEDFGRFKSVLTNFRQRVESRIMNDKNLGIQSGLKRA